MADEDQRVTLLGELDGLNVDLGDQRASGVNHLEVAGLAAFADGGRNSVGGVDDALAVGDVVDLMDEDGAFFSQLIHNIAVMDDFAADVMGAPKVSRAILTISIARTTPAQKPRGLSSNTLLWPGEVPLELPFERG